MIFGVWDARRGPTPAGVPAAPLLADVAALAEFPHPTGSVEARRQRARLTAELETLGLDVSVQRTRVQYRHPLHSSETPRVAWVENIIAQLPGTPGTDSALLMSHYDSVWQGPGAGDAASGVAALLAAARVATTLEQRSNTLIFLLTDGEEMGLFGAQAFFRQHELAKSVDLVLNFEARGNQGPPQMFQTSPGNAGLIQTLSAVLDNPIGNSLSFEVYRRMPNDTDLTISMGEGIAGLNFAFIDGYPSYHAMTDNPQRLSERSLRQQAENAVKLTTHLANADLALANQDENLTYFNLSSHLFVSYPLSIAWGLMGLTLLVLVLGLINALKNHLLTWNSLFTALAALVATALVVSNLFESLADLYLRNAQWRDAGFWRYFHLYQLNFLGGALLTVGGVLWLGRRLSHGVPWVWLSLVLAALLALGWWSGRAIPAALAVMASALLLLPARGGIAPVAWLAAFGLLWLLVALGLIVMLPHASYIAIALALPAGLALLMARPRVSGDDIRGASGLLFIPGVLLLSAMVYLVFLGLGVFMPQLPLTLTALLVAGIGVPFASNRSPVSTALVAAGATVLIMAPLRFTFDPSHPQPSGLFTLTNVNTGQTHWASRDRQPPAWAATVMGNANQFPLNEIYPTGRGSLWRSELTHRPTPGGPTLVADGLDSGNLHLTLSADAPALRLYFEPADSVESIAIDDQAIDASAPGSLFLYGAPAGARITIASAADAQLKVFWQAALPGLPASAPDRPLNHMPPPGTWSDTQIWHGVFNMP